MISVKALKLLGVSHPHCHHSYMI